MVNENADGMSCFSSIIVFLGQNRTVCTQKAVFFGDGFIIQYVIEPYGDVNAANVPS